MLGYYPPHFTEEGTKAGSSVRPHTPPGNTASPPVRGPHVSRDSRRWDEGRMSWEGRRNTGKTGTAERGKEAREPAHQTPLRLRGLINFSDLSRGTRDPCGLGTCRDTPTLSPTPTACTSPSLNVQQSLPSSYLLAGLVPSSARLGDGRARFASCELTSLVRRNLQPRCRQAEHGTP